MTKQIRQYIGLLSAVAAYYIIHEGAHLLYALITGVFKQINFMGLGIQIDIYRELLTDSQLGLFCFMGVVASQFAAYAMVAGKAVICRSPSKLLKAVCYYITIVLLLLDPLYLSLLCDLVGGGDMNGIALLIPEATARICFGILLAINVLVFWKSLLPCYTASFKEDEA